MILSVQLLCEDVTVRQGSSRKSSADVINTLTRDNGRLSETNLYCTGIKKITAVVSLPFLTVDSTWIVDVPIEVRYFIADI